MSSASSSDRSASEQPSSTAYANATGAIVNNSAFLTLEFILPSTGTFAVSVDPGADFDAASASAANLPLSIIHGPASIPANPTHWIRSGP